MNISDTQSVRKGNYHTLTLATPVAMGDGAGTSDYEKLDNKPVINGVEVVGTLTLEDLGIETDATLQPLTEEELDEILQ